MIIKSVRNYVAIFLLAQSAWSLDLSQTNEAMQNLTKAILELPLQNVTNAIKSLPIDHLIDSLESLPVGNLTNAIIELKNNTADIKDVVIHFTTQTLPQLQEYIRKIAELPTTINATVNVINHSVSIVEKTGITLGVCMVSAAIIYGGIRFGLYCLKRRDRQLNIAN